jgi:ACS family pantothenate transporter-like MFS transporter
MNMGSNAVNAWWILLFYSADFAPRFTKGMWAMIGCCIALAIWTTGIVLLAVREEKHTEVQDTRIRDLDAKQMDSVREV